VTLARHVVGIDDNKLSPDAESSAPHPRVSMSTHPEGKSCPDLSRVLVLKLSVVQTSPDYLLEIGGLFTQGSRPGRTFGEAVGGILVMDSSDWSNGIRHHIFDTRPDTEFNDPPARPAR